MTRKMEKAARLLTIISMITNFTFIAVTEAASLDVLKKVGDVSVTKCSLTQDCDPTELSTQSYNNYYHTDRNRWESLGLNHQALAINQIALGFVPAFQEAIDPNTPEEINAKLPRPMSIVGDYVAWHPWDHELKALEWKLPIIQKLEGNPVWCITLMPLDGLESITYEVAYRMAQKLAWINKQGVVVWLKLFHEMNGSWQRWGMKPDLFKQKWEMVTREVKRVTDHTYTLWSPNALFGDSVNSKRGGYFPYWPDPSTVDIVGISFYHWGIGAKRVNVAPTPTEAVAKLTQFAQIFGPGGWGKPVVVSETAACITYNKESGTPVEGGADEITIKMTWLHLLMDRYIKAIVPGFRAIIWFEIVKEENATGNTPVRREDFRLVMGNSNLAQKVKELFGNYHWKEQQRLWPKHLSS